MTKTTITLIALNLVAASLCFLAGNPIVGFSCLAVAYALS